MCRQACDLARALEAVWRVGVRDRGIFSSILRTTLEARQQVLATWSVWEPDELDGRDDEYRNTPGHDSSGRFVMCWHRAAGEPRVVPVTGYESHADGAWYWTPKRSLKVCRLEPMDYRFGPVRVRITSWIAPILHEGRFLGAAGMDLAAEAKRPAPGPSRTLPLHHARIDALSRREHEVFHWLRMGKTNDEIGTILGISHHTVKNHVERIFQKLGIHSRYEAMQVAQ